MTLSISRLVEELRKKLPKRIKIEELRDRYDSQLREYKLYNPQNKRTVFLSIRYYKYLSVLLNSADKWEGGAFDYFLKRDRKLFLTDPIVDFLIGLRGSRSFPRSEALVPLWMDKVYQNLNRVGKRSQTEYYISCPFEDNDRSIITDALDRGPDQDGRVAGMWVWYFDSAEEQSMAYDKIEYYKSEILKREDTMRKIAINESIRVPGTNIVLEKRDQILYRTKRLRESKRSEVEKILKYYDFEDQGLDTWDNYDGIEVIFSEDDDSIFINIEGEGEDVSFRDFLSNPEIYLFPEED